MIFYQIEPVKSSNKVIYSKEWVSKYAAQLINFSPPIIIDGPSCVVKLPRMGKLDWLWTRKQNPKFRQVLEIMKSGNECLNASGLLHQLPTYDSWIWTFWPYDKVKSKSPLWKSSRNSSSS
jgi:hypothetical protein